MLGHLKPAICSLNSESKLEYRQFYCGICAALRRENSLPYALFLNNELTLVLLAFQTYLLDNQKLTTPCPAKIYLQRNPAYQHSVINLASRLSLVLGWLKVNDWATDRPRFYKRILSNILQGKINKILPELNPNTQQVIQHYLDLTISNSTDFEEVRLYSGLLSQSITLEIGKQTQANSIVIEKIGSLFQIIGEMIAIADHLLDVEADLLGNQYNPIIEQAHTQNTTLADLYLKFKKDYNYLKINALFQLNELTEQSIVSQNFSITFQASINHLTSKITQATPTFMLNENTQQVMGKPILLKNDCDCGDCDCGCDNCNCCDNCGSCCECTHCCECGETTRKQSKRKNNDM
ncbi:MAG: DUF5685 family protein [Microscillaceae bacterium]|jgi:hypothetical protein|nr:DUF5685 family protein [Microscillaceae bacterium]